MAIAIVILAAGNGTRMNSRLPKVLHEVGNAALLLHAWKLSQELRPEKTLIVIGSEGDDGRGKPISKHALGLCCNPGSSLRFCVA